MPSSSWVDQRARNIPHFGQLPEKWTYYTIPSLLNQLHNGSTPKVRVIGSPVAYSSATAFMILGYGKDQVLVDMSYCLDGNSPTWLQCEVAVIGGCEISEVRWAAFSKEEISHIWLGTTGPSRPPQYHQKPLPIFHY
jgi:hypothetical protein